MARAPEQRTYGAWQFNEPQSAHGIGYEFSAQKTTPVKGHWAARVQAALYGKFYWDAHAYDDLVARAEAGPVWRDARQEIYAAPFYEQRWYGTEPFSRQTGGSIHYSRTLSPNWQMYAAWQSGYKQHNERTFLNGASHTGSLTLLYRTSPQQYFVMGIGGGQENAKDLVGRIPQKQPARRLDAPLGQQPHLRHIVQHQRAAQKLPRSRHLQYPAPRHRILHPPGAFAQPSLLERLHPAPELDLVAHPQQPFLLPL